MCAVRACDCRGAKTRAEGAPGDDSPRTLGFGTCQRTRHIGYRGGRIFCPAEADLSSCDRGSRTIVWRISQTILENAKTEKLPRAERFPRPIHGRHKRARITARIRTRAELVVESRSRLLERSSEPRLRLRTHPPSRSPTIEQNGHPRHAPPSLRAPRARARLALLRPVRPRAIPPSPARRSHRFVQSRSIRSRGDAIASARAEPSLPGAVHHRTTRPRRARARSRGADEDLPSPTHARSATSLRCDAASKGIQGDGRVKLCVSKEEFDAAQASAGENLVRPRMRDTHLSVLPPHIPLRSDGRTAERPGLADPLPPPRSVFAAST